MKGRKSNERIILQEIIYSTKTSRRILAEILEKSLLENSGRTSEAKPGTNGSRSLAAGLMNPEKA